MAVMNDTDRAAAWADLMRRVSNDRQVVALSKIELRAALDATDQWVSDNAAVFNAALPAAARTGLTASQKALLLLYVVERRYLTGV